MKTMMKQISAILMLLTLSTAAWALDLSQAKEQGLVGEQTNGYLGVIVKRDDVKELVDTVNAKRQAKYQELAKRNNLTMDVITQLAGKKAIEKTQAGHYIQSPKGEWIKK